VAVALPAGVANAQGVWRCPYPTKVCVLTLGDSFLARSFLSLVIDIRIVFRLFLSKRALDLFLFHSPPLLKAFSSFVNWRLLKVILNYSFYFLRGCESSNLAHACELATPGAPATSSSASPSISTCTSSTTIAQTLSSPSPLPIHILIFGSQTPSRVPKTTLVVR
jgi:hypothetical protein